MALKSGSYATGIYEPGQVRNGAALSKKLFVCREGAWTELRRGGNVRGLTRRAMLGFFKFKNRTVKEPQSSDTTTLLL